MRVLGDARVIDVKTTADDDGLLVVVTVHRALPGCWINGMPHAADVPPDVRATLRAWLDTTETSEST